jgi:hypothetical protein
MNENDLIEKDSVVFGLFSEINDALLLRMDNLYSLKFYERFDERKKEANENRPSQAVIGNCYIDFNGNRALLVNNDAVGSQINVPILLRSATEAYSAIRCLAEEALRKSQRDYLNIISGLERFVQ